MSFSALLPKSGCLSISLGLGLDVVRAYMDVRGIFLRPGPNLTVWARVGSSGEGLCSKM